MRQFILPFREWSVSSIRMLELKPDLQCDAGDNRQGRNGTNGDFCIRCHTQVGMILGEKEFMSTSTATPFGEGVTCVVCHRLTEPLGKISGRFPLTEGELTDLVYGLRSEDRIEKGDRRRGSGHPPAKPGKKVHGETRTFPNHHVRFLRRPRCNVVQRFPA